MSISHFIITRFNLRRDAADERAINPAWLDERFALFDRFCFPSVKAQTSQHFRWLVLFDEQTPPQARARIREYERWPTFIPVFFAPASREQARQAVQAQLRGQPPASLLTTRLDNDDALSTRFIELVQRHADAPVPTLVEFPFGYVWHRDRLYLDRQDRNPFSTLVEPLDRQSDFRTIYAASHHDVGAGRRVVQASGDPAWIQVIHGGNVANRPRGIRTPMARLSNDFVIEREKLAQSESRVGLRLDVLRTTIRDRLRRTIRAPRGRAA